MARVRTLLCLLLLGSLRFGWAAPLGADDTVAVAPAVPAEARVVDVALSGNFPFLESQVRQQLSLRSGDLYTETAAREQLQRLHEYYERQGYFGAHFALSTDWDETAGGAIVKIRITRGRSLRWGRITVDGNSPIPQNRIRSVFPDMFFYTPARVRQGIKELATLLHHRGFVRARVTMVAQEPDFAAGRMHLTLHIEQGPRLTVHFEGNQAIPAGELRHALTFYEEGRFDRYEIESSVANLQALYLHRGFPGATISAEQDTTHPDRLSLTLRIAEGARQTIWDVQVHGNRALSRQTLQPHIFTRPLTLGSRGILDPKVLIEDERALREVYHAHGFLDAAIGPTAVTTHPAPGFLHVDIPITEGPSYIIGAVDLQGNHAIPDSTLLSQLSLITGTPMNPEALPVDREKLQLYYADHGYPYAIIEQTTHRIPNTNTIGLTYQIREGTPATIGQISISGDFLSSQRAIRRAFGIEPGSAYSDRAIDDGLARLRRLGAFRTVQVEREGLPEQRPKIHLAIRLEEERPYQVDFDIGYSTRDHVTGTVRFTNINTLGWAKRTQLLLTGGLTRTRGELAWIDPWFLGSDMLHTASAWVDRTQQPAFDLMQSGGGTSLHRQYHRTGFLLRYQMTQNRLLNGDAIKAADDGYRDTTMSQLTAGASFDTRDNFANPQRGWYLFGQTDAFNELRGQRADYVKLAGGVSRYISLGKGIVLSGHGRIGGIVPIRDAVIPIADRFFLGGEDTLRGFTEDGIGNKNADGTPRGGTVRWITNTELSCSLGSSLRLAAFYDLGGLVNNFSEISGDTTRASAGLGARYITPIGPIRFDYAVKLDRRPDESAGRLHFTFGHVF